MATSDRLLQLLQLMRTRRPPIRAAHLADELSVSLRTVYRDIDRLRAAGAVIEGEAGFGYTLAEDPALPPMMFSRDEMEALVLGLGEVREVGDPVLAKAAQNALGKLKASLPARVRNQLDHAVLHAKRFHERPPIKIDMAALRQAARDELAVDIHYRDLAEIDSERRVRPLSVVFMDQALVLLTWCQLRADFRIFRVDRIEKMSVSDESFRPHRVPLLRQFHEVLRRQLPTKCRPGNQPS